VTTFRIKDGILFQELGRDLVLFDLETNLPYALNPVGSLIFRMIDGERTLEEIAERISREYDVGFDQAMKDLLKLSEALIQRGIIKQVR